VNPASAWLCKDVITQRRLRSMCSGHLLVQRFTKFGPLSGGKRTDGVQLGPWHGPAVPLLRHSAAATTCHNLPTRWRPRCILGMAALATACHIACYAPNVRSHTPEYRNAALKPITSSNCGLPQAVPATRASHGSPPGSDRHVRGIVK
jgi:hypothetical protein